MDETQPPETLDETQPPETLDETQPPETWDETPPETLDETQPPEALDETQPPDALDETQPPEALDETFDAAPTTPVTKKRRRTPRSPSQPERVRRSATLAGSPASLERLAQEAALKHDQGSKGVLVRPVAAPLRVSSTIMLLHEGDVEGDLESPWAVAVDDYMGDPGALLDDGYSASPCATHSVDASCMHLFM